MLTFTIKSIVVVIAVYVGLYIPVGVKVRFYHRKYPYSFMSVLIAAKLYNTRAPQTLAILIAAKLYMY